MKERTEPVSREQTYLSWTVLEHFNDGAMGHPSTQELVVSWRLRVDRASKFLEGLDYISLVNPQEVRPARTLKSDTYLWKATVGPG